VREVGGWFVADRVLRVVGYDSILVEVSWFLLLVKLEGLLGVLSLGGARLGVKKSRCFSCSRFSAISIASSIVAGFLIYTSLESSGLMAQR
jgi:hypothetical protein